MGVDTKVRLNGRIKPEEILNFVKQKFDTNAKMSKIDESNLGLKSEKDYVYESYDNDPYTKSWSTSICFNYKGENRNIFYVYSNYNAYENLAMYKKYGLESMVKSETTTLILGCWGTSVEIMRTIVEEFGGWIDENDCDDIQYEPVVKNPDGTIKPVIRVTIEEVYEKFGGIVIIDGRL